MSFGAVHQGGPSLAQQKPTRLARTPLTAEHRAWYLERLGNPRTILAGRSAPRLDPRTGEVSDGSDWDYVPATAACLRQWSHIRIGGPKYVAFVNVDIDLRYDEAAERLRAFPLAPNLRGENINSGHMQAEFLLAHPVNLGNPRERDNLAALQVQLTEALGGDPAYTHATARNPLAINTDYIWFWGHAGGHTISELRSACYEVLGDDWRPSTSRPVAEASGSDQVYGGHSMVGCTEDPRGFWWDESGTQIARARTLFEVLRHAGYDLRRAGLEGISESQLQPAADRLLALFQEVEPRRRPLHPSNADATIRSVVKFCNQAFKPGMGGSRSQADGRFGGRKAWSDDPEQMERFRRERAIPARVAAREASAALDGAQIRLFKERHPDLSQRKIAEQLGCSQTKVHRALSDAETTTASSSYVVGEDPDSSDRYVNESPCPPPANHRVQQVAELTAQGYTNTEIAHELDISMRTVRRLRAQIPDEAEVADSDERISAPDDEQKDSECADPLLDRAFGEVERRLKDLEMQDNRPEEGDMDIYAITEIADGPIRSPELAPQAPNGYSSLRESAETLKGAQMVSERFRWNRGER